MQSGDSLYAIAERELGDGNLWPALARANGISLENADLIRPGQQLVIPGEGNVDLALVQGDLGAYAALNPVVQAQDGDRLVISTDGNAELELVEKQVILESRRRYNAEQDAYYAAQVDKAIKESLELVGNPIAQFGDVPGYVTGTIGPVPNNYFRDTITGGLFNSMFGEQATDVADLWRRSFGDERYIGINPFTDEFSDHSRVDSLFSWMPIPAIGATKVVVKSGDEVAGVGKGLFDDVVGWFKGVSDSNSWGGIVAKSPEEAAFIRNAGATFGDGSVYKSAIHFDNNIVIQRSDIPFSAQNVRRMAGGNTPFVKNASGEWEKINLHHVGRQDGKVIEVLKGQNTYNPSTGGPLHIPGPGGPVRDLKVGDYWQQRLQNAIDQGLVSDEAMRKAGLL